ncbi:hypothetical protein P167DRAFT_549801 [Morchella conica CCBAS932]|uniref:Uncharacterized protein n=1 Tax=Morchella conica CCBAS932 TaxID=1392247 RepID=A0A3N4KA87_9PEZI|nr:hypothetical protein P167DRAFT_549801 [Morchella conica CCBAS932]
MSCHAHRPRFFPSAVESRVHVPGVEDSDHFSLHPSTHTPREGNSRITSHQSHATPKIPSSIANLRDHPPHHPPPVALETWGRTVKKSTGCIVLFRFFMRGRGKCRVLDVRVLRGYLLDVRSKLRGA